MLIASILKRLDIQDWPIAIVDERVNRHPIQRPELMKLTRYSRSQSWRQLVCCCLVCSPLRTRRSSHSSRSRPQQECPASDSVEYKCSSTTTIRPRCSSSELQRVLRACWRSEIDQPIIALTTKRALSSPSQLLLRAMRLQSCEPDNRLQLHGSE